jgi:hypothetical protein
MNPNDPAAFQHVVGHLNDLRQLLSGAGSGYGPLSPETKGEDGTSLRAAFLAFRDQFPAYFEPEAPIRLVAVLDTHDPM